MIESVRVEDKSRIRQLVRRKGMGLLNWASIRGPSLTPPLTFPSIRSAHSLPCPYPEGRCCCGIHQPFATHIYCRCWLREGGLDHCTLEKDEGKGITTSCARTQRCTHTELNNLVLQSFLRGTLVHSGNNSESMLELKRVVRRCWCEQWRNLRRIFCHR
jgi:hypothetical protein